MLHFSIEQKQRLNLNKQLLQSIRILQMNSQELEKYIDNEVESNPVLDAEPPGLFDQEFLAKLKWLENQNRTFSNDIRYDEPDKNLLDKVFSNNGQSLEEYLFHQLNSLNLSEEVYKAGALLIGYMDRDGRLEEDVETLSEWYDIAPNIMAAALATVQMLDPPGVGARDLNECLYLQLERKEMTPDIALAKKLVSKYIEPLSKRQYAGIAKSIGVKTDAIKTSAEVIFSLNPHPGSNYAKNDQLLYVMPDVIVEKEEDRFSVRMNHQCNTTLRINKDYLQLEKCGDAEVQQYLLEKIKAARQAIKNIDQRRSTVLACAEAIADEQAEFFLHGPKALKPLTLATIAGKVNIHPSTVSRAIKGKYLQCSHGTFPMAYFFSRELGGENLSPEKIKVAIANIIQEEDRAAPLTDEKIVHLLQKDDISISRRTVAKYRSELGVPTAAHRKQQE